MPKISINSKSMDNSYNQILINNKLKERLKNKLNLKHGKTCDNPAIVLVKGRCPDTYGYYSNKNTEIKLNSLNSLK